MKARAGILVLLVVMLMPALPLMSQETIKNYGNVPDVLFPYDKFQQAYLRLFQTPMGYYGAGREEPVPTGLKEVRIGFLGPLSGSVMVPQGKQMLQGAMMALEESNAKGGYRGIPFTLMVHNDVGLWGAAANELVKMDDEKVWAWMGSIDDIVSHVAIRATLKLEIPMVCTGDPDPTFTETGIPWVIRVISDDRQASYALSNYVYNKDKHSRVAVIRANNRYGRVGILHFNHSAIHFGHPVIIEERFGDGETDFNAQLKRIKENSPDAIVIWGNARESALILKQIRDLGMKQAVYGSDRMVNPLFLSLAGNLAEGVTATCQYNPDANNPKLKTFREKYIKRFGIEPDVYAAHAYDGMNMIIESIQKAGLNRALIRDVLTDMKTFQNYPGVTGKIVFDATWNDIGDIFMAQAHNGKFNFFPTLPLDPNKKYKPANMQEQKTKPESGY